MAMTVKIQQGQQTLTSDDATAIIITVDGVTLQIGQDPLFPGSIYVLNEHARRKLVLHSFAGGTDSLVVGTLPANPAK